MSNDDLDAAARAASSLASQVAAIRALAADGAATDILTHRTFELSVGTDAPTSANMAALICERPKMTRSELVATLSNELNERYPDARAAIEAVKLELMQTRDHHVRFGDIVASTAHEAALKMLLELNKERFGVEDLPRPMVEWPDEREVLAEIGLENAKAKCRRAQASAQKMVEGESGNQLAKAPRLTVNLPSKMLTLDAINYPVGSERALRWVKILAERTPTWISSKDLGKLDEDLLCERTDKYKNSLPKVVLDLIDSRTGAGSRIRLDGSPPLPKQQKKRNLGRK